MPIPNTYELIVSPAQLARICEALQAYDIICPLDFEEVEDPNLEYLTRSLVATLLEPAGDGTSHGICL